MVGSPSDLNNIAYSRGVAQIPSTFTIRADSHFNSRKIAEVLNTGLNVLAKMPEVKSVMPLTGLGFDANGLLKTLFADGAVRRLSKTLDPKMLAALFTRSGGEVVDLGQ